METGMKKETARCLWRVFSGSQSCEQTTEVIIPDAQPDVHRLLTTGAVAFLRGKEASDGRLEFSAAVRVTALYLSEEGEKLYRVDTELPVRTAVPCQGADAPCKLSAAVQAAACEARLLNPRKLHIRVEALFEAECWREETLPISCLPEEENGALELCTREWEQLLPTAFGEKSFVVSDEYSLPGQKPAASELLSSQARLAVDDVKQVGSKLVLKGTVFSTLLYGSAESVKPSTVEFSTEYSQILELDLRQPDVVPELRLALTGAYYSLEPSLSQEERRIVVEIHVAAQCTAYVPVRFRFVADAYAPGFAWTAETETLTLRTMRRDQCVTGTVRGTLNVPTPAREVLHCSAWAGRPELNREGDGVSVRYPVNAAVLYLAEDGALCAAAGRVTGQEPLKTVPEGPTFSALVLEPYAAPSPDGLELRVPVELTLLGEETEQYGYVTRITTDETSPLPLEGEPSLILHRMAPGDTLWELAKTCHSTRELILSANGAAGEDALTPGTLLILPKRR